MEILRKQTPSNPSQAVTLEPFPAPKVTTGSTTIAKEPLDATMIDKPIHNPADAPTVLAGPTVEPDAENSDASETIQLDRAPPTEFVSPLSGPRVRISDPLPAPPAGPLAPRTFSFFTPWRTRPRLVAPPDDSRRQRQIRIASAIAGLVGLALISFLVALCASRSHGLAAPKDAAVVAMTVIDAALPPVDAAGPDAAVAVVVVAPDAAPAPHEAYLEIVTFPEGGKVKVGDQVRIAPAQIIVEAGTFDVVGELAGYQSETRPVTIEAGEHEKVELTFNHHVATPGHPVPATGKLTVRTTPYSEVFENGKKLGETPFADREMTAGVHMLVFKNPLHPTVSKKITITAGTVEARLGSRFLGSLFWDPV